MTALLLLSLGILLLLLFTWSFRTLPGANWQFLATTPFGRSGADPHCPDATNFTWYGVFSATAYAVGAALFIFLMGAAGMPPWAAALAVLPILLLCVPASRILVWIVEGKAHGFTVGGASFVGLFAAPACLWAASRLAPSMGFEVPVTAGLAAVGVSYVLGEGIGRLACISFGCCYGKPVDATRGWLRQFSERFHFIFEGETKKIAFAGGLEGVPVVPVQAMTATVYGAAALAGIGLFFLERYGWAIAVSVGVCQLWRIYSETFRADYRGELKFTAYQTMAVVGASLALSAPWLLPSGPAAPPSHIQGLLSLWNPASLLFLQTLWFLIFLHAGRSTQTRGEIRFSVRRDRI